MRNERMRWRRRRRHVNQLPGAGGAERTEAKWRAMERNGADLDGVEEVFEFHALLFSHLAAHDRFEQLLPRLVGEHLRKCGSVSVRYAGGWKWQWHLFASFIGEDLVCDSPFYDGFNVGSIEIQVREFS